MGRIAAAAVDAGALGFTTSRTLNHRTSRGEPTPTLTAAATSSSASPRRSDRPARACCRSSPTSSTSTTRSTTLRAMVGGSRAARCRSPWPRRSGAPLHYRRAARRASSEANADGLEVRAQVAARAIGILLGLQGVGEPVRRGARRYTRHSPTSRSPSAWRSSRDPRSARRSSPSCATEDRTRCGSLGLDQLFALGDRPDYEPDPASSVAARAARQGVDARRARCTTCCSREGGTGAALRARSSTTPTATSTRSARCCRTRSRCPASATAARTSARSATAASRRRCSLTGAAIAPAGRSFERAVARAAPDARDTRRPSACSTGACSHPATGPTSTSSTSTPRAAARPSSSFDLPAGGKRLLQRVERLPPHVRRRRRDLRRRRARRARCRAASSRGAARAASAPRTEAARELTPIISADSHITEPPNTYIDYIDPAYRDRAPKMIDHEKLGDVFVDRRHVAADLARRPRPRPASGPRRSGRTARTSTSSIAAAGIPSARLADQDRDGVAAEIIYPTVGMILCNHPDLDYKRACFEAYNRWIAEYCSAASRPAARPRPDRDAHARGGHRRPRTRSRPSACGA